MGECVNVIDAVGSVTEVDGSVIEVDDVEIQEPGVANFS